ncbi:MAG: hypothetical protein ACTSQ1_13935, partial [Promethearchaeota archaeon]
EAPFPIGLPYKCLKMVPNIKTVLDPFGGTCSTLAACLKLGVKGYAYEKYPRVEVIKSRILEGKNFHEIEENLIPHLEFSLRLLNDLLPDASIVIPVIKSKAEFNNFYILNEVLNNLHIDNSFKSSLEKRMNHFKESLHEKREQEIKFRQTKLDFKS